MGALGTLLNFATAAVALAVAGPFWAVIAFLAVVLVRVTLDSHILRRENELLQERVTTLESGFELDPAADAPPESGTRPSRGLVEKRAS